VYGEMFAHDVPPVGDFIRRCRGHRPCLSVQ
jgi:hypothetical protein